MVSLLSTNLELLKFLLDPVRLSFSTSRSSLQLTGCIPSEMKGWLKCRNLLLHVQQFSYWESVEFYQLTAVVNEGAQGGERGEQRATFLKQLSSHCSFSHLFSRDLWLAIGNDIWAALYLIFDVIFINKLFLFFFLFKVSFVYGGVNPLNQHILRGYPEINRSQSRASDLEVTDRKQKILEPGWEITWEKLFIREVCQPLPYIYS